MSARSFVRENAFLIAAVALPVVVVTFFVLASAIPRWTVPPPQYDLLLRVGNPYYDSGPRRVMVDFTVRDGQVEATARPLEPAAGYSQPWTLLLFEHETLTAREIPFSVPELEPGDAPRTVVIEGLAGRRVIAETKSPDGYEFRTSSGGGSGIVSDLFGMRRYDNSPSVVKNGRVIPLKLPSPNNSYYSPVHVLGWLAEEGR